jgi:hypothetical protein
MALEQLVDDQIFATHDGDFMFIPLSCTEPRVPAGAKFVAQAAP